MEELKAEIIQLPRKKSNLILGGMDSSGKEIKHIEKLLTVNFLSLKFLIIPISKNKSPF